MMNYEFQYRDKIPVAILGATGCVGQYLVQMLSSHPWFSIASLSASEKSQGKPYKEAVNWLMSTPVDPAVGDITITPCDPSNKGVVVFSALDASVAAEVEKRFAEAGRIVISCSSAYRMSPDVPLLIPEVNSSHLDLLQQQPYKTGKILTKPNCTAVGLTMALKPLYDKFGIEALHVVTMQAISGAGYPGLASLDIVDNLIPYIAGETEKVETEPQKILGAIKDGKVIPADFKISAQCTRVPITDGHTACVSIKLKSTASPEAIIAAWNDFSGDLQPLNLQLAPERPLYYFPQANYPQPKLHRHLEEGMSVAIGGLTKCPLLDYKFTLCSNNMVRGAAGGAILTAELLLRKGLIFW